MLGSLRHDERVTLVELDDRLSAVSVPNSDIEPASEDQEELVGFVMAMPDMLTQRVCDPHVIVVHRGHDAGAIHLVKRGERLVQVDRIVNCHASSLAVHVRSGLYVIDVDEPLPDRCRINAWRPDIEGVSEVFHAQIVDYGYPPHCHDTWTLLIVDSGAISYDLDNRQCGAVGQTVAILPPGVTHDGKPAPGAPGFAKRVLYLEASFLRRSLIGAAVDQTNIDDPVLRRALASFHHDLTGRIDSLSAETSLALIAERVAHHLETNQSNLARPEVGIARQLRALLDANSVEPVTLTEAAAQLDRSKPHLIRSFTAAFGLAPHAYVIGKRVEIARKLLLDGVPTSEAAVAAGFYDQSHLTRHFKRHTSIPPAEYASSRPQI